MWEAEAGESDVQGHSPIQNDFYDSLGYKRLLPQKTNKHIDKIQQQTLLDLTDNNQQY